MLKLYFSPLFFLMTLPMALIAQNGQLRGTVSNSSGAAAAYVSILIKENQRGAVSNDNGFFGIDNIQAGTYTLVASFVGYKTLEQKITIEADKTLNLDLELYENAETLREIVIKGTVSQNERIVAIGKLAVKPMNLPLSIQTLDRQTIENQQIMSLQDALMNTNGMYVSGATGGYQEEISARGYTMGSTNTFKNGARYLNSMLPEVSSLERIEVLKGSAAILFGNVTAGGVINLVTKKPRFDFGGEIDFRTGSFGLIKPIFDVYGGIGRGEKVAFRVNGTYQKANSFRQYVSSERFYVNPSLLVKIGKKTEFLLEGDYLDDRRTPDFGAGIVNYQVIPDFPRARFLGVKWGYVNSKQASVTGTVTHHFNDNWKLAITSTYRNAEQALFSASRPNTGTLIRTDGTWIRNLQKSETYDNYYIVQGDLNGHFKTGKIEHHALFGFDSDQFAQKTQAYAAFNRYDTINIFADLPLTVRNDVPNLTKGSLSRNPTSRYGVYAQDLVGLSEKLKVLVGIRYSNQKSESRVTAVDGTTTTTVTPAQGAFSPRLGIVFLPRKNHSVFASYTNSFTLNTGVDTAGKALPPSTIHQYEVGSKNEILNGKASVNLTAYRIDNTNLAQISLANGNTNANIRELAGYVRSQGVELDFSARLFESLNLMLGYSYNETKYVKSNTFVEGSLLRYNPNHTANASVFYQKTTGILRGLSAGFTTAYIGQRYAGRSTRVQVANDAYRLTPVDAYFQCDVTAGYTFKNVSLRAKVGNIFDVLSYNVHDDNSVNPIAPRNYSVQLCYKF